MVPAPPRRKRRRPTQLHVVLSTTASVVALRASSFLIVTAAAAAAAAFVPSLPVRRRAPTRVTPPVLRARRGGDGGINKDGPEEEDWRAYRARLVRDGLPSLTSSDNSSPTIDTPVPANSTATGGTGSSSALRYAHESGQNIEVGTVLLSIPTTDLCQALEQQYWHRAAVLITAVAEDVVRGDEENVPEDQLAQGAGRGRWSYRGLVLNRCCDWVFDDVTGEQQISSKKVAKDPNKGEGPSSAERWRVWRGGDLAGLDSSDGRTEFVCLHGLTDVEARAASTPIVGQLAVISLNKARELCEENPTKYGPGDFYVFGGYSSWRPGQLEAEMGEGREEWVAASIDGDTILDEIRRVYEAAESSTAAGGGGGSASLLEAGTGQWRNFLGMVGWSESRASERIPPGQLGFYDRMLEAWVEENLMGEDEDGKEGDDGDRKSMPDSSNLIGPGTLVRASPDVSNDMLLFDQEFIRSLVLVLEETPEATVGVILNHPLAAAVECLEGASPLPLRYGGPIDVQDWRAGESEDGFDVANDENDEIYEGYLEYEYEPGFGFGENKRETDTDYPDYYEAEGEGGDHDDSSFIWLHRDAVLGSRGTDGGGGTRLGTSGVWLIKESDAIGALQSGVLDTGDVMVFAGVCVWERAPDLGSVGGGIREQIDALQSLEIVRGSNDLGSASLPLLPHRVWDILSGQQDVLSIRSFEANVDAAIDAWAVADPICKDNEPPANRSREALSDAALRAWVAVNLLGDPLGTLIEVTKARGQELRGQ